MPIAAGVLAQLVASPDPFAVAPNEVIEGDFELKYLPGSLMAGNPLPRDEDVLLLWTYFLPTFGEVQPRELSGADDRQMQSIKLVGVTFLSRDVMTLLGK